jgi:3'-5' exonuclease
VSTIVYDIEVAGEAWDDVDPETRAYLAARARDDQDRETLPDRTALFPGLGRVIAIGLHNVEAGRSLLLLDGPTRAPMPMAAVDGAEIQRGNERELLTRFWEIAARPGTRLVTYNGRGFDGPVLMVRSAQLGVPCSRDLVGNRFDLTSTCDLMDVLSFFGARRESYSLDYWCRRFGVASPKGGFDGSQVTTAYREGRIDEIGEYCLRDVRATAQLYERLAPTILHLFRGGPRY